MTGHQATFWHPGILAKFIACDVFSALAGAAPGWIVVDQDDIEFTEIPAPVLDDREVLSRGSLRLTPADGASSVATAVGIVPAFDAMTVERPSKPALPSVAAGLDRIVEVFSAHGADASAGRQVTSSLADLMRPLLTPAPTVFATSLWETDLFNELCDRMTADPAGAASSYNAAVARHPGVGVTPLHVSAAGDDAELPIWSLIPGEARRRVRASELAGIPREQLAPRALFLTGILRLAASDLFIHGVGGAKYDVIGEEWFGDWLGEALAPAVVVSADLHLPLPGAGVTRSDVARAVWHAHSARHQPLLVGDHAAGKEKAGLVDAIARAPRRSAERARLFHSMHEALASYRTSHESQIQDCELRADELKALFATAAIAGDRTWAFPLHDDTALQAMRRQIERMLADCRR